MTWPTNPVMASNAITAALAEFYVIGSGASGADTGKNLVTSTPYTVNLLGSASYGSDSLGVYAQTGGSTDAVQILNEGLSVGSGDFTVGIVFTRTGALGAWATLFEQERSGGNWIKLARNSSSGDGSIQVFSTGRGITGLNVAGYAQDTECCVVLTRSGTTCKAFMTGASSMTWDDVSMTADTLLRIRIGNSVSSEPFAGRFRAYFRAASALSDVNAQSVANNPQAALLGSAPAFKAAWARGSNIIIGVAR